jgi:zinc protease
MSRVSGIGAAFAALLTIACLAPGFAGPALAADENTILPDPNVHLGVLANGLRYAIMKNGTPAGGISLRLAVDVGSFEENPGEYGVAHFLEHMAFSGGQNARETGPEKAFANAGVSFGRDVNAFTTLFYTQYRLDLPSNNDASLALAFTWLRTVADGAKFSEDAVDRERDVILSERAYRMTPQYAAEEASDQFQMPGLRSTRKDMMGSVDDLHAIHGKDLLSFYKRWYRPENAVVIVVGDVDPATLEKRIRSQFASWKGEGPAPARPAYGTFDESRGLDATAYSDARLSPSIGICRARRPDPRGPDDVARLRRETLTLAWTSILNSRLSALTKSSRAPFLAAQMIQSDEYREVEQSCAIAALVDADWQKALHALAPELREFAKGGPTEAELDGAIDAMRSAYRGILDTAATRKSSDLADAIMKAQLRGDVVRSPSEGFRAFDVAVENVTPDDDRAGVAERTFGRHDPQGMDRRSERGARNTIGTAKTCLGL